MRILMVAYYFPPDASSGSFRPLQFARYLKAKGEEVTVLTAREADFLPEQPRDVSLVPDGIETIRTAVFRPRERLIDLKNKLFSGKKSEFTTPDQTGRSGSQKPGAFQRLKDFITTALACPDIQSGWFFPGLMAGKKKLSEERFDLIFATGGPWTVLAIAAALKWLTKLPLVMDFRDPWVSNPNFKGRPSLIQRLETWLEKKIIHGADLILANTEELKQDFLTRHVHLKGRVETLTNGFDRYYPEIKRSDQRFVMTHAGALYLNRNPVHLVRAVVNLARKNVITPDNFRLNFVGGIDIQDTELEDLMALPEVNEMIHVIDRVPFETACRFQQQSDLLFLIQPDFPLQVPRKLYEYMAFGKPVLAITEEHGATARVVRETRIGQVVDNRLEPVQKALEKEFMTWQEGQLPKPERQCINSYTNTELCKGMHIFLKTVVNPLNEAKS